FFQAEDGIRDGHVTGVQTCALPISVVDRMRARVQRQRAHPVYDRERRIHAKAVVWPMTSRTAAHVRSERELGAAETLGFFAKQQRRRRRPTRSNLRVRIPRAK